MALNNLQWLICHETKSTGSHKFWNVWRTPDEDTDYFDIVVGVLQGDTLASYLFIISLDYVLRTSIDLMRENSFKLTKERSRRYPAQIITDADYVDYIALLANASGLVWFLCLMAYQPL